MDDRDYLSYEHDPTYDPMDYEYDPPSDAYDEPEECEHCGGIGWQDLNGVIAMECPECGGDGEV